LVTTSIDSATAVLMELNLPTANKVSLNYRSLFIARWMSHSNSIVSLIREVYMFTPWSWCWRLCLCSCVSAFYVLFYS